MKNLILKSASALLLLAAIMTACQQEPKVEDMGANVSAVPSHEDMVKHGEYLVTIMGCDDCHTPMTMGPEGPVRDPNFRLGGHPANAPLPEYEPKLVAPGQWALFSQIGTAVVGPWGTSYAANLTSDATGIGAWQEEQFIRAIREGKYKGLENSRPLMPPMPWQLYAKATDEDLKAIFAYLKTVPPVRNVPPATVINPPPPQLSQKQ